MHRVHIDILNAPAPFQMDILESISFCPSNVAYPFCFLIKIWSQRRSVQSCTIERHTPNRAMSVWPLPSWCFAVQPRSAYYFQASNRYLFYIYFSVKSWNESHHLSTFEPSHIISHNGKSSNPMFPTASKEISSYLFISWNEPPPAINETHTAPAKNTTIVHSSNKLAIASNGCATKLCMQ